VRIEEFDIEEQLRKDAKNIKIDQQFKMDLKERIMTEGKKSNVVKMQTKKKMKLNRYFKIASSFMICVFVGGTLYKVTNIGSAADLHKSNETENNRIAIKEVLTISSKNDKENYDVEKENIHNDEVPDVAIKENSSSEILKGVEDNTNIAVNDEETVNAEKEGQSDNNAVKGNDDYNLVDHSDSSVDSTVKKNEQQNSNTEKEDKEKNEIEDVYASAGEVDNKTVNTEDLQQESNNNSTVNSDNSKEPEEDINKMIIDNNQRSASGKTSDDELSLVTPEIGDVKEENEIMDSYNRYSSDKQKKLVTKTNGVYVNELSSGEESLVISIDSDKYKVEKPNFLPNGDIIYVRIDNTDKSKNQYEIYKYINSTGEAEKLTDGKNPFISKDGNRLAYEFGGKICIMDFDSNITNIIDDGKYPAWSYDGQYVSYVKEENETEAYDEITKEKDVYVEKKYSTMWIYNIEDNNKYAITNIELITKGNMNKEEWAQDVIEGKVNYNFQMIGKYTYFESIWSENNKEIYVRRRDNKSDTVENVVFNVDREN
jgi:hypothetical protein